MKIKKAVKVAKGVAPLVPVFGGWKAAAMVFTAVQVGAPLLMKGMNRLKENLDAKTSESEA